MLTSLGNCEALHLRQEISIFVLIPNGSQIQESQADPSEALSSIAQTANISVELGLPLKIMGIGDTDGAGQVQDSF